MLLNPYRFINPLSPPEIARYWRILILGANGAGFVEINELKMKETEVGGYVQGGGNDLIQSSQAIPAFYAFDGGYYGPSTVWRSAGNPASAPEYIGKDFNTYGATAVSPAGKRKVSIFEVQAGSNIAATPKDFNFQFSDDFTTWETVYEARGLTDWVINETKIFTV